MNAKWLAEAVNLLHGPRLHGDPCHSPWTKPDDWTGQEGEDFIRAVESWAAGISVVDQNRRPSRSLVAGFLSRQIWDRVGLRKAAAVDLSGGNTDGEALPRQALDRGGDREEQGLIESGDRDQAGQGHQLQEASRRGTQ